MKSSSKQTALSLNQVFEKILSDSLHSAKSDTAQAVEEILYHSKNYLGTQAHDALKDYYQLYFSSSGDIAASKEEANDDVTAIFEAASQALHANDHDTLEQIRISADDAGDEKKESRLRLSAINKKLEAVIRADASIKEKLLPIVSNIQFEDLVNHRLTHLENMWKRTLATLGTKVSSKDKAEAFDKLRHDFSLLCSSVPEKKLYYPIMLKKEAPLENDIEEAGVFLAF